jgi:hypothetical protein
VLHAPCLGTLVTTVPKYALSVASHRSGYASGFALRSLRTQNLVLSDNRVRRASPGVPRAAPTGLSREPFSVSFNNSKITRPNVSVYADRS